MEENKEVKNEEVNEEVVQSEAETQEQEEKLDRPEKNYQAELARKNAEIERLRAEHENLKNNSTRVRNPQDLSTWSDHELKAVKYSNDPQLAGFKDQADEILLERRVKSIRERERMQEKRASADIELHMQYPDAADPTSDFSLKMEQAIHQYDLQKTPAGRLVAAKIVQAEMSKGKTRSSDIERNRVRDVKANMVDGDRSKPPANPRKVTQDTVENLEKRIRKGDDEAMLDVLKDRGISRDTFFGNRNRRDK